MPWVVCGHLCGVSSMFPISVLLAPYAHQDVEGWEDVTQGAGGVFKKLVREGDPDGRIAKEGDLCSCHLAGYYDDMEFENTRAGKGFPWEFHCGGMWCAPGQPPCGRGDHRSPTTGLEVWQVL